MKPIPQTGMIPFTAWYFGERWIHLYTLVDVGIDNTDRVRWLMVRSHTDEPGLLAALTMAYAGLADVSALDLMSGRGVYAGMYQVTLSYANE